MFCIAIRIVSHEKRCFVFILSCFGSMEYKDIVIKLLHEESWVLFENGTVVAQKLRNVNIVQDAMDVMKQNGLIEPGTASGDFDPSKLDDYDNTWIVSFNCNHPISIIFGIYVAPSGMNNLMLIGLSSRQNRHEDVESLIVVATSLDV